MWLTIDDGPDPDDTGLILDLLDRFEAKATFFVKGEMAERYPELVREVARRGHELGNHSFSHPSGTFWCLPPAKIRVEIDRAGDAIERITGARPSRFRAPVGMKNPFVHPALDERGLTLIGWSARGWDTVAADPERTANRIIDASSAGAILLTHQGRNVFGRSIAVECLGMVLGRLSADGFRFVVPENEDLA